MKEYPEKGALLRDIERIAPPEVVPLMKRVVDMQPVVDVVEAVRCRDCEYCDYIYPKKRLGEEAAIDYFCKLYGALVEDDGFCGVGARKEQT